MGHLFVREQGAVLRKRGERLVVQKDEETLAEVRCHTLDAVCVFGGVQVTTDALAEILRQGIDLALLTLDGRLKGRLVPPCGKNVYLRLQQFERCSDDAWCLRSARSVVAAKVTAAGRLVGRYCRNHPGATAYLGERTTRLAELARRAASASDLDALRGIEGTAAAEYFLAYGLVVPKELAFPGRRRRPPTDPVNALLSLGYVLLANRLSALVEAAGLDPAVGFFHQLRYGRPSLALDLAEEFRTPVVDRLVARLLNLRLLTAEDFEHGGDERSQAGGTRLRDAAFTRFLGHYRRQLERRVRLAEDRVVPLERALEVQVERLAAAVRDGVPYRALTIPI